MKAWQLTKQAEKSLYDIASWTLENFGEIQAAKYRDELIHSINRLANEIPPLGKSCVQLMQCFSLTENLLYYHQGKY